MGFTFRLATSLRLAKQETEIAQGLLANEMRILYELLDKRDRQKQRLLEGIEGQKKACLKEPLTLQSWSQYVCTQKEKVMLAEQEVLQQEDVVSTYREKLLECKIKLEKFERLKEKKLALYYIEELKKEQAIIDEIAQSKSRKESG